MSEKVRESLSVLMDGEASELDLERTLKHSDDPDVRATWMRYHAVKDSIQGGSGQFANVDISAGVMAALEREEPVSIKPVASWRNFMKPAASFAVAASVFASVLVGSQFYGLAGLGQADTNPALAASVSTVGMVNTLGGSAVRAGYATPALKPANQRYTDYNRLARERLQRYMLAHSEEASLNAPQGMMPYARVASFQVED